MLYSYGFHLKVADIKVVNTQAAIFHRQITFKKNPTSKLFLDTVLFKNLAYKANNWSHLEVVARS